eukprot:4952230-Amphidinium_carterae.1
MHTSLLIPNSSDFVLVAQACIPFGPWARESVARSARENKVLQLQPGGTGMTPTNLKAVSNRNLSIKDLAQPLNAQPFPYETPQGPRQGQPLTQDSHSCLILAVVSP